MKFKFSYFMSGVMIGIILSIIIEILTYTYTQEIPIIVKKLITGFLILAYGALVAGETMKITRKGMKHDNMKRGENG